MIYVAMLPLEFRRLVLIADWLVAQQYLKCISRLVVKNIRHKFRVYDIV